MRIEFDKAKFMAKAQAAVKNAVHTGAIQLQSAVKAKMNQHNSSLTGGSASSPPGMPPGNNTGALMRSVQVLDVSTSLAKPTYRVGSNMAYARIQEYGGRIRAKKGKFLPVPVGVEGRRAAREAKGNLRSLNLTLIRTKGGQLLLVKELSKGQRAAKGSAAAKGAQMVILFVLKKEVYLPPRPSWRPAYAAAKPVISKLIADATSKVMAGVN